MCNWVSLPALQSDKTLELQVGVAGQAGSARVNGSERQKSIRLPNILSNLHKTAR